MGFMAAKHLFTASAIGLFEALAAGPASLEEIAEKTDVPPRTLGIIAAAMVSLGLLERQGNLYQNGAIAGAFLGGAGGPDMRPMLRFWDRISYPAWEKLEEAVGPAKARPSSVDSANSSNRSFRKALNPSRLGRPRHSQTRTISAATGGSSTSGAARGRSS
jgi:hypothetical protein